MPTANLAWWREERKVLGIFPNSTDCDNAIRRYKGKNDGMKTQASKMTIDNVSVNV